MSDFAAGFSAGSSAGNAIQQRILAKKLQELENTRYEDEKAYNRGRDTVADQRYAEERDYRRGRDTVADTRYGDETDYRRGRDTIADTRYADETTYNRNRDRTADRRQRLLDAMALSGGSLGQVADAIKLKQAREAHEANMQLVNARTEAIKSGRMGGTGGYGYDEYGPDGELVKRRVPVAAGAGAPAAGGQEQLSPEAQEIANRIAALQTQVGQHKVQMAQGDNRTGFLNLQSRQGKIDAANAEIGKLRAMQGGGAPQAQPGAQLSPQDQQALAWAKANPNDPRATAILQRLGAR